MSIGIYKEKTLHAALKLYYEPNPDFHEVKVGRFIADIKNESGITEIQTRNLGSLRKKLDAYLPEHAVTIVFPIPHIKYLAWIDKEDGNVTKKRKSPKTGSPYHAFRELYGIKNYLAHPNLTVKLSFWDMAEYRYLDGWSHDKKRGSTRCERIPLEFFSETVLSCAADYAQLLPDNLPTEFGTKDFTAAAKLPPDHAGIAVNILYTLGVIERIGKKGNAYIYQKSNL